MMLRIKHYHLLGLFAAAATRMKATNAGEFNREVMGRVSERLGEYMRVPVDATARTRNFRSLDGFPNDMAPTDRDFSMTYLYSEVRGVKVYYGMEDGSFLIYSDSPSDPYVSYREPGNSGYDAVNVPEDMRRYFDLCVNRDDGSPEVCVMSEGATYIECTNGCELQRCPDADSQRNCSALPATNRTECESKVKWCAEYTLQEAPAGGSLGFVPRIYACIDEKGQMTQNPGNALKNSNTGELGTCYFRNGVTKVNQTIEGDFAYCGGDGAVCNNTFLGMYRSRDYDPRYRSWYLLAKERQIEVWSDPYPFFSTLEMGVTFARPIYSIEGEKNIFKGVLAVDYSLGQIADFLSEQYAGTDINVLVVEAKGPNYVIAASTGSPAAILVLNEDESQPCPFEEKQDTLCTVVRVPIDELNGVPADAILQRAFDAQDSAGWPRSELVSVKISDDPLSAVYVSQSEIFEQENANLQWRVIVVMPTDRATNDAVLRGDSVFVIICLLGGLGFFICFMMFLFFFGKREDRAVIHADWRFTCAFILGCATLNLSTFTLLGDNTDPLCMLRMWSFNGLFACAISPLFVKVWRMYRLFNAAVGFQRVNITHFQAALMTLPIVIAELVLLTIFSFVDPPREVESIEIDGGLAVQHLVCDQETRAFFIVQVIFHAVLVLIGCVLAIMTRDLDPRYGEAKQLGFAMYNIAFTGTIIVTILQVVDMDQSGKLILQSIGILWGSLFSAFAFVLPRLIEVVTEGRSAGVRRASWQPTASGVVRITSGSGNVRRTLKQHGVSAYSVASRREVASTKESNAATEAKDGEFVAALPTDPDASIRETNGIEE